METNAKKEVFIKFVHELRVHNNPLTENCWVDRPIYLKTPIAESTLLKIVPFQDSSFLFDKFKIIVEALYKYSIGATRYNSFLEFLEPGTVIIPSKEDCPSTLKEFINSNQKAWSKEGEDLLKLIRWRYNSSFILSEILEQAFWSIDKENWQKILINNFGMSIGGFWIEDNVNAQNDLQTLINQDRGEPLYFDIFHEARSQSTVNERSSFVLAVVALEIAVKQLISKLKPDTAWLLENLPSPPIEKILSGYFPQILTDQKISESALKDIKSIINERNELVHRGIYKLSFEQLHNRLYLIEDLLHKFDEVLGNEWALKYTKSKNLFN